MPDQSFVELVLSGQLVDPECEIGHFIARWHKAGEELPALHEWIRMTWDEYALFVEQPTLLRAILMARKFGIDVNTIVNAEDPVASIAARGISHQDILALRTWLTK